MEGKINNIEKSLKYNIFINNSQVLSENYSPVITVADLRTYLLMHIPKECSFINANKQTPIPQELEDFYLYKVFFAIILLISFTKKIILNNFH